MPPSDYPPPPPDGPGWWSPAGGPGDPRRPRSPAEVDRRRAATKRRRAIALTTAVAAVAAIGFGVGVLTAHHPAPHSGATAPTSTLPPPVPTTVTPPTTEPPLPVTGVPGGMNFGSYGESVFSHWAPDRQAAAMAQVAATGVSWMRVDVFMRDTEPELGQFHWNSQALVDQAVAHGLAVDVVLAFPSPWSDDPAGQPNPAIFGQFARAVAQHYQSEGVRTFEIWNEPNLGSNWGGGSVPIKTYVSLLQAGYKAINAVEPDSVVMIGGLSPAADRPNNATVSPQTFLQTVYSDGGGGYFDAVADHPYSYPDLPATPDSWNPWVYLPGLHDIMAANGDGAKRIWFTEYGAPTAGAHAVSVQKQALSFLQAFAIARKWPWAGPLFAFDWIDTPADGSFGLLDHAGQAKIALSALSEAIANRTSG